MMLKGHAVDVAIDTESDTKSGEETVVQVAVSYIDTDEKRQTHVLVHYVVNHCNRSHTIAYLGHFFVLWGVKRIFTWRNQMTQGIYDWACIARSDVDKQCAGVWEMLSTHLALVIEVVSNGPQTVRWLVDAYRRAIGCSIGVHSFHCIRHFDVADYVGGHVGGHVGVGKKSLKAAVYTADTGRGDANGHIENFPVLFYSTYFSHLAAKRTVMLADDDAYELPCKRDMLSVCAHRPGTGLSTPDALHFNGKCGCQDCSRAAHMYCAADALAILYIGLEHCRR
jgi:hypothetical protein